MIFLSGTAARIARGQPARGYLLRISSYQSSTCLAA